MFNFYDHTAALAVIGGLFLAPAMPMNAQAAETTKLRSPS